MRLKVDCRIRKCTPASVATVVTVLRSAMHLVGRKAQLASLAVEPHSAIALDAMLDRRILLGTERRFVMLAVERLRLRAPTGIEQRFVRRVAAAWAPLINQKIRPPFEMPVVARQDRHPSAATEQHSVIALGICPDRQIAMLADRTTTIQRVCQHIAAKDIAIAKQLLSSEYPFVTIQKTSRNYTPLLMTQIFIRDGFIDRYRGTRLIFPPVLRLLSHYLPNEFPFHKNGKMSEGHIAYWELPPTIDHVVPVARGGTDTEDNWVCCSMLTNSIKSNWTMEQLQWRIHDRGWFLRRVSEDPSALANPYIKKWHGAATRAVSAIILRSERI